MKYNICDKRGFGHISTAVIIIALSLIFACVFGYAKTMTVLRTVKEDSKRVLDSCVIENAKIIYSSIKQGHSRTETVDGMSFKERFSEMTGAECASGELRLAGNDGNTVYVMSDPVISLEGGDKLWLKAEFTVYIRFTVMGSTVYEISVPMCVKSKYVNYMSG